MTIVHFQSTTAAGTQVAYILTAGQGAPGPSQGTGFASGTSLGTYGVLVPSDFKQAKIIELSTIVTATRLIVTLDDQALSDGYFSSILIEGFAVQKVVDADAITHSGGNTSWTWDGFGALVNTQVYDVVITG